MSPFAYEIVREQITWTRWDAKALRHRTSHPWVWTVREDGKDIKHLNTKAEAQAWIEDQG